MGAEAKSQLDSKMAVFQLLSRGDARDHTAEAEATLRCRSSDYAVIFWSRWALVAPELALGNRGSIDEFRSFSIFLMFPRLHHPAG